MFITRKRHEREKQELKNAGSCVLDAILKHSDQGVFVLDGKGRLLPQVSRSLAVLFQREDFSNLTFEKLLAPIVSAKVLSAARSHLAGLPRGAPIQADGPPPQPGATIQADVTIQPGAPIQADVTIQPSAPIQADETIQPGLPIEADVTIRPGATTERGMSNALKDIEVRLPNPDGSSRTGHYWFDFDALDIPSEAHAWLVRVTDITMQVQTLRELADLRGQGQVQTELLRGLLQLGRARFGTFLQRTDTSMNSINSVLKKPARAEDAFRGKLKEILGEVDRIRLEAATFKLTALESSARRFEDDLHELRGRPNLSGGDFLPLAVKLDDVYSQFSLVRSLAAAAGPVRDPGPAPRTAPAGSLDGTLRSLTDHIAEEQNKRVILEILGLEHVPSRYQAAVKNVAIQFIRNAVVHGIEAPALREAAGKAAHGTLRLEFKSRNDRFELLFEDDGRGVDPDRVRAVAIERGMLTGEAAAGLRDREAIKLIFKSGFTTLAASPTDRTHGKGLSLVRRYIHEAGGKVALASVAGRETRFKLTLPPLSDDVGVAAREARTAKAAEAKVA